MRFTTRVPSVLRTPTPSILTTPSISTLTTPGTANYLGIANPFSMYANPYGGYTEPATTAILDGTADLIRAEGKWDKSVQEALIQQEQNKRAKIDTRSQYLAELRYERDNTPTPEQERQRNRADQLTRSLNNPPVAEIYSGQALNALLDDAAKFDQATAVRAPQAPIDQAMLGRINVAAGNLSLGILRHADRLDWPTALQEDEFKSERQLVNSLVPEAVRQASSGKADPGALADLSQSIASMRQKLAAHIGDLSQSRYADAGRFLAQLENATRVLAEPSAGALLSHKLGAENLSASALVAYMHSKGLRFALSLPGDENAYVAVHHALVKYHAGAKAPGATPAETSQAIASEASARR